MTTQSVEHYAPADSAQTLAVSLECPDCGARRAFKFALVLEELLNRNMASIGYAADCEHCRRKFSMVIGWAERKEGWTVQPIGDRSRAVKAEDVMSLKKP